MMCGNAHSLIFFTKGLWCSLDITGASGAPDPGSNPGGPAYNTLDTVERIKPDGS